MQYLKSRLRAATPILSLLLSLTAAGDVVYVTDLPIYSDLVSLLRRSVEFMTS